jgi:glutamyl-tRNA synthetase
VVRGDDLATATPSQLHLQRRLGLPQPRYAHVPLVLGPTGERLAKRHGAVTLNDRLRSGDTVDDVARWLLDSCGQQVEDELSAGESMAAAADRFDPGLLDRHPLHVSGSELDRSLRSRG